MQLSLNDWLARAESAHPVGIDMGLARFAQVAQRLGLGAVNQALGVVITVGGTNGKGSTCVFLSQILQSAGYKVALHTSPHLLRFNERAVINGAALPDEILALAMAQVHSAMQAAPAISLTYFEWTTLACVLAFAQAKPDVTILEIGLGGRLDAVNYFESDCAIITSIDLDHQAYLGDTREQIAFEKAHIYRANKPAICADPAPPQSLLDFAQKIGADVWLFGRDFNYAGDAQQWSWAGRGRRRGALGYPGLRGVNQLLNASAALAALEALSDKLVIRAHDVRSGLLNAHITARFQVLAGQPARVIDVAHNPHSAAVLAQNLDQMGYFPETRAVFGAMADKDIAGMARKLKAVISQWYVCDLPLPRAASATQLKTILLDNGVSEKNIFVFSDAVSAYDAALASCKPDERVVVFGSFHTAAPVLAQLKLSA